MEIYGNMRECGVKKIIIWKYEGKHRGNIGEMSSKISEV